MNFENIWKGILTSTIGAGLMGLAIYGWYFEEALTNNEALVLFGVGFSLLWIRGAIENALKKLIIELPTRLLTKWFGKSDENPPAPTAIILLLVLSSFAVNAQYYNMEEGRFVDNKPDSTIISGVGQIRWDAATGKFRFGNGTNWFTYSTGSTTEWGDITGTLSDQTDLQTSLDGKVGLTGTQTITGTKTFDAAIFSLAGSDEVLYRRSSDGLVDGNSQFTYGGGGNPVQVPSLRIANLVSGQVPYTIVNDELDGENEFAYNATTNTLTVDNITALNVMSGLYTPTLTATTNVDAVVVQGADWVYIRVGNAVTVSGQISIDATAASTVTSVRVQLPIASNFANSNSGCSGTMVHTNSGVSGAVRPDPTNDEAQINFSPAVTSATSYSVIFLYTIL